VVELTNPPHRSARHVVPQLQRQPFFGTAYIVGVDTCMCIISFRQDAVGQQSLSVQSCRVGPDSQTSGDAYGIYLCRHHRCPQPSKSHECTFHLFHSEKHIPYISAAKVAKKARTLKRKVKKQLSASQILLQARSNIRSEAHVYCFRPLRIYVQILFSLHSLHHHRDSVLVIHVRHSSNMFGSALT